MKHWSATTLLILLIISLSASASFAEIPAVNASFNVTGDSVVSSMTEPSTVSNHLNDCYNPVEGFPYIRYYGFFVSKVCGMIKNSVGYDIMFFVCFTVVLLGFIYLMFGRRRTMIF